MNYFFLDTRLSFDEFLPIMAMIEKRSVPLAPQEVVEVSEESAPNTLAPT